VPAISYEKGGFLAVFVRKEGAIFKPNQKDLCQQRKLVRVAMVLSSTERESASESPQREKVRLIS